MAVSNSDRQDNMTRTAITSAESEYCIRHVMKDPLWV
jgi:hypothetical protein